MELGNLGNGANGRQLEGMVGKQAAAEELFRTKERTWNKNAGDGEPDFNRIKATIALCFIFLYVISVLLSTILVQQHYQRRYLSDLDSVHQRMVQCADEDSVVWLNCIGDMKTANDGQLFSAAIYDVKRNLIAATEPYLRLKDYDGNVFYFAMKDYFVNEEIDDLLISARANGDAHLVNAVIDTATGQLSSIKVGVEGYVLDWKHTGNAPDEENRMTISRKMTVQEMISVPFYEEEETYEKWIEEDYLHNFAKELDVKEDRDAWNIPLFGDSKQERITKVTFKNEEGQTQIYYLVLRATGNTLAETMKLLMPMYFVGFILTMGGVIAVDMNINKLKKK